MKVYFIGAGPGSPELMTLKGKSIIEKADILIYAGSLVNVEVLQWRKEDSVIYNSASMDLNEVLEVMRNEKETDKIIARVHTGDPSIYGAIREQIDHLKEDNIPYEVIPGVSSFTTAAATLGMEFTLPSISQTVILTRKAGRTPVPEKESIRSLATHRASMAIFLSVGMIDDLVEDLLTSYPETTPVAVVQRASWEDERFVLGTLADIAEKVKSANITKQAQILVGDFLGNEYEYSKLYDPTFTHEFRQGKEVK